MARPVPGWVMVDSYLDTDLGVLKTGKEAEVRVVERTDLGGRGGHLLAQKRYRPRTVSYKGQLEALGFEKATTFRNDAAYRTGRWYGSSRDRRAVERGSAHGRSVVAQQWLGHEHDVLRALWDAGVSVPYPVSYSDDAGLFLEYLGARDGAAPRLAQARLGPPALASAWEQLIASLRGMVAAGWVHADLSAFNLLWWEERLWVIDVPQAVDLVGSPSGFELLHRDVTNVCGWFGRQGIDADADAVFTEALGALGAV